MRTLAYSRDLKDMCLVVRAIELFASGIGGIKNLTMLRNALVWMLARNRRVKQFILMFADAAIVVFSVWFAYCIRFNEFYIPNQAQAILMLSAPAVAIPLHYGFGLYRSLIRYVGEDAIWLALKAVGLAGLIWACLRS